MKTQTLLLVLAIGLVAVVGVYLLTRPRPQQTTPMEQAGVGGQSQWGNLFQGIFTGAGQIAGTIATEVDRSSRETEAARHE